MELSEKTNELFAAMAVAVNEISNTKKTAVNPFYKKKYTPLDVLVAETKPILIKHGLFLSQFPTKAPEGHIGLTSILGHSSGQWMKDTMITEIEGRYNEKAGCIVRPPQTTGIALTYSRRYAYASILGVASEDDNDGNGDDQKPKAGTPKPANKPAPKKAAPKAEIKKGINVFETKKYKEEVGKITSLFATNKDLFSGDNEADQGVRDFFNSESNIQTYVSNKMQSGSSWANVLNDIQVKLTKEVTAKTEDLELY